jgi:hypothetical protein
MEIKALKTLRFANLVESAGHPVPVTLWTEPENDPEFSKAVREHRVLTVIQRTTGGKADYGLVGFFKQPFASYLVFPRALDHPPETKVVGIKYDELAEPKPKGPIYKPQPNAKPQPASKKVSPPGPERPTEAAAVSRAVVEKAKPVSPPHKPAPKPSAPHQVFRFRADVEIQVRQTKQVEVEATSQVEATRLLKEKVATLLPDLETARIVRRTFRPKKIGAAAAKA